MGIDCGKHASLAASPILVIHADVVVVAGGYLAPCRALSLQRSSRLRDGRDVAPLRRDPSLAADGLHRRRRWFRERLGAVRVLLGRVDVIAGH